MKEQKVDKEAKPDKTTNKLGSISSILKMVDRNTNFAKNVVGKLTDVANSMPNIRPLRPPKMPVFKPKRYNQYQEEIEKNEQQIKLNKAKIEEKDRQLDRIGISKNIPWGIGSLVFFSIVGIIVPLILLPIDEATHLKWKGWIIVLFILGLGSVFAYVFYELYYIRKKKK